MATACRRGWGGNRAASGREQLARQRAPGGVVTCPRVKRVDGMLSLASRPPIVYERGMGSCALLTLYGQLSPATSDGMWHMPLTRRSSHATAQSRTNTPDGAFAKGAARLGHGFRRDALIRTGEEEARLMRPVQLFCWHFMAYPYLPQDFDAQYDSG